METSNFKNLNKETKSMLNVNTCANLQLAITFMTKIIHITEYQSFVDTLCMYNAKYSVKVLYKNVFECVRSTRLMKQ